MLLTCISIATVFIIMAKISTTNIRGLYNIRRELRQIKTSNKKAIKRHPQYGTLIGYAGRREIYISDDAKHVFICGTTGSGKTVVMSNFIKRALMQDIPSLIIDGKGDTGEGSILEILYKMRQEINPQKKIYVINLSHPEQSDSYNPFQDTSPTVAKDMIINMTEWSEEHYKLNTERYIQRILQLLKIGNIKLSFKQIIKCIPTEKFIELSKYLLEKELITKDHHINNIELSNASGKIAGNAIARFATIAESEIGHIFAGDGIDISKALEENAIILFVLNPLTYPELSPAFARLVLIDAKKAVAKLYKSNIKRTFFIMDEINTYATPVLTDLLNKSRSARVTCILGTQSLSDLDFSHGNAFKEQIIENCNNYIVLRQNSGINAEHWAKILGTKQTMDVTYQLQQKGLDTSATGFGSARRVREFLYHPDDIKTLQTGKGIFLSRDNGINNRINVYKPF